MRVSVAYASAAECPRIKKFLDEVLDKKFQLVIEELAGYCLVPNYQVQRAFLLTGEGANGKSTLIELLRNFLGTENCSSVSLQALGDESQRFNTSLLYGKLANVYADVSSKAVRYTGIFKQLTGGDEIKGERKNRDAFFFKNHAKLVFSTNRPPEIVGDDSYAFWRRWILIPFTNVFEGDKADKKILERLTTKEELSGFLNLALEGLRRLEKQGDFSYTKSPSEVAEEYVKLSQPVYAFCRDRCVGDFNDWVSKEELYQAFLEYCTEEGIPMIGKESFGRLLKDVPGFNIRSTQRRVEGSRVWGWEGIRLQEKGEEKRGE
jgi:putative DNA primase/helicase